MNDKEISNEINYIIDKSGFKDYITVKNFYIGRGDCLKASIVYVKSLVDKEKINENILKVLMLEVEDDLSRQDNMAEYICRKYIIWGEAYLEASLDRAAVEVSNGKSAILIENAEECIIVDTVNSEHRPISDPENESSLRGTREGFVESVDINISMLKRFISDKSLEVERFKVGRRSQLELAFVYIKSLADDNIILEVRRRINSIDTDFVNSSGMVEQYIEDSTYALFPQTYATERPDVVAAQLMDGKIALILNQTPFVITVPSIFPEFFQTVEDYFERTLIGSFTRILRFTAAIIVITLPSLYLTLISYNVELIPIKFIIPIINSRQGIPLPPFLEILLMEIIIEFLREGGLRLPPKIAATLSIVGGIIIGNAAIESKVASPSTLLIIGVSTIASFLIPNFSMSRSIRFIGLLMLILSQTMGFLGIATGWIFLIVHLFSLKSFGNPYFTIKRSDLKDLVTRAPLWAMKKRPASIPVKDQDRKRRFKENLEGGNNG